MPFKLLVFLRWCYDVIKNALFSYNFDKNDSFLAQRDEFVPDKVRVDIFRLNALEKPQNNDFTDIF